MPKPKLGIVAIVGPGMLVAATGVGAGDLATGAIVGTKLGIAILWAVIVGAGLKFLLNEGLARWQLATGSTLLEGCSANLGAAVKWIFLFYLLLWSYMVGAALMSACGITAHTIQPIWNAENDKLFYAMLHSLTAVAMIQLGGYHFFEKVMRICIGVMFVVVVATAIMLTPSLPEFTKGLFWPRIPHFQTDGIAWTIALMGGVGGTLTVLCYGYWMREEKREGLEYLRICRIDLAVGYAMTAAFGISMVVIGSQLEAIEARGAVLITQLADKLQERFLAISNSESAASFGRFVFLIGCWSAVSSSLLGVWQSVPYMFADLVSLMKHDSQRPNGRRVSTKSWAYRGFLFALALVPALGLRITFVQVQKTYAVFGALFIPLLALVLLLLNGDASRIGKQSRNSALTTCLLIGTILVFLVFAWFKIRSSLFASAHFGSGAC